MKHYVKPECRYGCRFLQITDDLWLCPHAAYGQASYKSGAVAEARALLERSGGYAAVLARLEQEEFTRAEATRARAEGRRRQQAQSLRYE